jgi:nucleoside-diphosphate-sugar epimerase
MKLNKIPTIYTTGLTGFIGKSLLPKLLTKYKRVINFRRNNQAQIYIADSVSEQSVSSQLFQENPAEEFINLATLYDPSPINYASLEALLEANILFPSKILHAVEFKKLKVLNALSYHQLLDFPSQNIYSLSKEIFKKFLDSHDFEVINLYIFDTFGKGDTRNKVTDVFIRNILDQKPISIPKNEISINLSDGEAISSSIIHSINLKKGSYSLAGPDTISLTNLAKTIMQLSNSNTKISQNNLGRNYFAELPTLPTNAFKAESGYSLNLSLQNRIDELKNEL